MLGKQAPSPCFLTRQTLIRLRHRRFNLFISKLERAAASKDADVVELVFGAGALRRWSNMIRLSRKERDDLHTSVARLAAEALRLIDNAFPVQKELQYTIGDKLEDCTTKRARFNAHEDGYFTYLTIPNLNQHDPTPVAPALLTGISTADMSAEWLQTLIQHFGDFPDDASTAEETVEDSSAESSTGDDAISENLAAGDSNIGGFNSDGKTTENLISENLTVEESAAEESPMEHDLGDAISGNLIAEDSSAEDASKEGEVFHNVWYATTEETAQTMPTLGLPPTTPTIGNA
jgi:hypothetical protein